MSSSYRKPSFAAARRSGTVVASAVLLMTGAMTARSASWQFNPRVEVGGTYDDNYLLGSLPSQETSVAGPFIDAQLELQAQTPLSTLSIVPEVHATLYPGHSDDQSTDGYLNVSDVLQTQESKTSLNGSYADQTVVAADLLPSTFPGVGLGQPVIGASGYVEELERQQTWHLFPATSLQLTQRDSLQIGVDYYHVGFSSSVPNQVGFQSVAGTLGTTYQATPRSSLSFTGQYSDFIPEDNYPGAHHGGLDGEWDYQESKVLRFYIRAGAGVTDGATPASVGSTSVTDFEGGIGAQWTLQVTNVVADLLRTAVPSSFGVVVNQNELRFRVTRSFSPTFAGFFALRGIQDQEAVTGFSGIPNRVYATGSAGIEWRLTRAYSLEASYTHALQRYGEYETFPAARADSNSVGISVVYEPNRENQPELFTVGSESPY